MKLRSWRLSREPSWLIKHLAAEIEKILGREMQVRTLQRYEQGENQTPTDVMEAIYRATHGAVTANDMHRTRRDYMADRQMLTCPIWDDHGEASSVLADQETPFI